MTEEAFGIGRLCKFIPDVEEKIASDYEFIADCRDDYVRTPESKVKILQEILTYPPLLTVVHVNDLHFTLNEAEQLIRNSFMEQLKHQAVNLQILHHPCLSDVVMIPAMIKSEIIKPEQKEVIVDSLCGMSVLRGADVYAMGIKGADPAIRSGDRVSIFADIHDQCQRGTVKKFTGYKLFVGNGVAKFSRNALFKSEGKPSGLAVAMTEPIYIFPSLNEIGKGALFLQNLPSIVASHVLDPQEGETILDMCSAPGGKTTHIATLMKNKGVVIALDKSSSKLRKVEYHAKTMKLSCIKVYAFDSTMAVTKVPKQPENNLKPPFSVEVFDRILLDPPCSGLGQRPRLVSKMSVREFCSYACYQRKLFSQAVQLLKVGGVLVYCTCTLTLSENEKIIAWALANFRELELCRQNVYLGGEGVPVEGLSNDQAQLLQRFDPADVPDSVMQCHRAINQFVPGNCEKYLEVTETEKVYELSLDTIGFFIAKFKKICTTRS